MEVILATAVIQPTERTIKALWVFLAWFVATQAVENTTEFSLATAVPGFLSEVSGEN